MRVPGLIWTWSALVPASRQNSTTYIFTGVALKNTEPGNVELKCTW